MNHSDPVFVQPLLGADDAWAGYKVESAPGTNDKILTRLCASPQLAEFDQRLPWFLPASNNCSGSTHLGERLVSVFPAQPAPESQESLKQLEARLRQCNSKVGLIASANSKLPATGTWDFLLIGASHARCLPPYTLLGMASRTTIVATDVHSHGDRDWMLSNACTLCTSEFLLTRSASNSKADITRLKLLKLLTLIDGDADTGALETIFREEAKLSYSLLRLVNSAALAPRSPIVSFAQAINLLGRRQLQRWLQLLVYSDPNNGQHPTPLLQKAASRGRILELLVRQLEPALENPEDTAFMIGTFSLLDVLLNMSISDILHQLPLPPFIHNALAAHDGPLGTLLSVMDAADKNDLKLAATLLEKLGIDAETYLDTQLDAYSWAAKIRPAA
ncbi:MAG: putative signal transduction protein containing and modified domain [Proteobacteria bacterium]|nr:putative signal transduction protein containing and modified domain [Pseudomonadota bacterium]